MNRSRRHYWRTAFAAGVLAIAFAVAFATPSGAQGATATRVIPIDYDTETAQWVSFDINPSCTADGGGHTIAFIMNEAGLSQPVNVNGEVYQWRFPAPGSYSFLIPAAEDGTTVAGFYLQRGLFASTRQIIDCRIDFPGRWPEGDSMFLCGGLVPDYIGTNGPDNIVVTPPPFNGFEYDFRVELANDGRVVVHALDGNDTIRGTIHRDNICGGDGNDWVFGGRRADDIFGGPGRDRLLGGKGGDLIDGGDDGDKVYGDVGNDTLFGGAGNDRIFGGLGDDSLFGGRGNRDLHDGGDGLDVCSDTQGSRPKFRRCEEAA